MTDTLQNKLSYIVHNTTNPITKKYLNTMNVYSIIEVEDKYIIIVSKKLDHIHTDKKKDIINKLLEARRLDYAAIQAYNTPTILNSLTTTLLKGSKINKYIIDYKDNTYSICSNCRSLLSLKAFYRYSTNKYNLKCCSICANYKSYRAEIRERGAEVYKPVSKTSLLNVQSIEAFRLDKPKVNIPSELIQSYYKSANKYLKIIKPTVEYNKVTGEELAKYNYMKSITNSLITNFNSVLDYVMVNNLELFTVKFNSTVINIDKIISAAFKLILANSNKRKSLITIHEDLLKDPEGLINYLRLTIINQSNNVKEAILKYGIKTTIADNNNKVINKDNILVDIVGSRRAVTAEKIKEYIRLNDNIDTVIPNINIANNSAVSNTIPSINPTIDVSDKQANEDIKKIIELLPKVIIGDLATRVLEKYNTFKMYNNEERGIIIKRLNNLLSIFQKLKEKYNKEDINKLEKLKGNLYKLDIDEQIKILTAAEL